MVLVAEVTGHFHACLPVHVVDLPGILLLLVIAFGRHLCGFLP